ncbi:MAG: hypothetical protein IJN88_02380 [Clostridia bacterium]|nr:hypothetical protein [Clostridia bacterium]
MKKLVSILLAVLMLFSCVTVAFAEGEDAVAPEAPDTEVTEPVEDGEMDLGEFEWILDLPFWTVGPSLKLAKIALKLVNVFLKVAKIFGLVDKDLSDYIIEAIVDMIESAQNGEQTEEPTTAPAEESTTAPAAA